MKPKILDKRAVPLSLGPKSAQRAVGGKKPHHSHSPLLSQAGSSGQFESINSFTLCPTAEPGSVAPHTQTPLRAASEGEPPEPCLCVPPCCPTTGTSVVPLVLLAQSLRAWLVLPSPSGWLLQNIRLGYVIQFAWRPSKLGGIQFTAVKAAEAYVL